MKPVDQTVFGDGSGGREAGNCWSACIASLLELPLDEVPNFNADITRWFEHTQDWLRARGLWILIQSWEDDKGERCVPPRVWSTGYIASGALVILSGPAVRGFDHAVVAVATPDGPVLLHDPHYSRSGLIAHKDVSVILPLNLCFKAPWQRPT